MVGQVQENSVAGDARPTGVCITNYPFSPWNRRNYKGRGGISSPDPLQSILKSRDRSCACPNADNLQTAGEPQGLPLQWAHLLRYSNIWNVYRQVSKGQLLGAFNSPIASISRSKVRRGKMPRLRIRVIPKSVKKRIAMVDFRIT